ncbi:MAG: SDR family oxidoreductase [Propionibacteriales bacterium]|nr:SDR family oxidoreductase [Propionibacteriales bacterium]
MRNILVTGASSGIGEATTLLLAAAGMRVFAGVRDAGDGAALQAKASRPTSVQPVVFDVRDPSAIHAAVGQIASAVGAEGLAGLVNDAGEGFPGPLEMIGLDQLREQLEVNVVGQVAVTQAALPLIRQGQGRIVFVGSIGGKVAVPFAGPYHASKYAIEAIGDSLRQELQPDGIAVSIVEPGPISTAIWSKAEQRVDELLAASPQVDRYRDRLLAFRNTLHSTDDNGGSVEDVAKVIETALTASRPSARYPVGGSAKVASALKPWVPDKIYDAVVRRFVAS